MAGDGTMLERLEKLQHLEQRLYTPYPMSAETRREMRRLMRGMVEDLERQEIHEYRQKIEEAK